MKYQIAILLKGSEQVWKFEIPKNTYEKINEMGLGDEGLLEFTEDGGMELVFRNSEIQGLFFSKTSKRIIDKKV